MDTTNTTAIADEVVQTLVSFVPALVPYGTAIELAFTMVANVAPPLYQEIKSLISGINAGTPPTDADIAALRSMVAQLKNPDQFFNPEIPLSAPTIVTPAVPTVTPTIVTPAVPTVTPPVLTTDAKTGTVVTVAELAPAPAVETLPGFNGVTD